MSVETFLRGRGARRPNPGPEGAVPGRWQVFRRPAGAARQVPWAPLFAVEGATPEAAWGEMVGLGEPEGPFALHDVVRLETAGWKRTHGFVRRDEGGDLVRLPTLTTVADGGAAGSAGLGQWAEYWGDDWANAWQDCPRGEWLVAQAQAAGVGRHHLLATAAAVLTPACAWASSRRDVADARRALRALATWAARPDPFGLVARTELQAATTAFYLRDVAWSDTGQPLTGLGVEVLNAVQELLSEVWLRGTGPVARYLATVVRGAGTRAGPNTRTVEEAQRLEDRAQAERVARDHLPLPAVLLAVTGPSAPWRRGGLRG